MKILVLCPIKNEIFKPIAKACHASFQELGHKVDLAQDYRDGYDLILFVTFYHPWKVPPDCKAIKVGYHMEPLPWKNRTSRHLQAWAEKYKNQSKLYDWVIDTSQKNVEWLRSTGYRNIEWCALGYHETFEMTSQVDHTVHCPVSFIGNLYGQAGKSRRKSILRRINTALMRSGVPKIRRFEGVYGTRLANVVMNTDVHVNLHISEQFCCEYPRLIMLLSNRQFIITETIEEHHPFMHGKHLIEVNWKRMAGLIEYYLAQPDLCKKIATNGYNLIRDRYRLKVHLARALGAIGS